MPPAEHLLVHRGHALPDRRIVQPRRGGAAFDGCPACRQLVGHGRPPVVQRLGENRHLLQLLLGEGHPSLQLGVEPRFVVEIQRAVQQRTGRGDHDPLGAKLRRRSVQQIKRSLQIAAPDVAAVDHAQRERQARRRLLQRPVQLLGHPHQVEMHGGHRQP